MTEKDLIIQDLRRENAELRASAPKWISVEDMLPEQGEEAICIAAEEIDRAPTIDAVPVVRCKDCAVPHNKYTGCPKLNGLVTPPDFYCPFGERKDGDGND